MCSSFALLRATILGRRSPKIYFLVRYVSYILFEKWGQTTSHSLKWNATCALNFRDTRIYLGSAVAGFESTYSCSFSYSDL